MDTGNGFTTKEMLVRIDAKIDSIGQRVSNLEAKQAVHESLSMHAGTAIELRDVKNDVRETRDTTRRIGPVLTVIITLANGAAVAILANLLSKGGAP